MLANAASSDDNQRYRIDAEASRFRGRLHPNQTPLYHQGDTVESFFRVNSGVVMVYRMQENSQRQIFGFYTEGDFFGLSLHDTYQESAVTVTTSNVVALTLSDIHKSVELQKQVFAIACGQMEVTQNLIATLTKKTASEKVAAFLVMLADRQHCDGNSFDIRLPMSRLDIADYLGLTIETVSRRFTALKTAGVISLPDRNTVRVNNFATLLAQSGPA